MTRTTIPNCPQEDKPIRDRAWTDEQRWQMLRRFFAEENDVFMNALQNDTPSHPTEAQLDAACDAAINAAIAAGATP